MLHTAILIGFIVAFVSAWFIDEPLYYLFVYTLWLGYLVGGIGTDIMRPGLRIVSLCIASAGVVVCLFFDPPMGGRYA